MQIRPFQAVFPDMDYITSSDSYFKGIKKDYLEYRRSRLFKRYEHPGFYVYRIQYADHEFYGLIAVADINDYREGRIKAHENTLADKEQVHLNLLLRNQAIVKPVLLAHTPVPSLRQFLHTFGATHEPLVSVHFEAQDIEHTYWAVTDPDQIRSLQEVFRDGIGEAYIADGHHRSSATSLLLERLEGREEVAAPGLFSAFFAADEVEILDFNRIVDAFVELTPISFMARLSQVVDMEELSGPAKPTQKHEMTMYLHREWYKLTWKPQILESLSGQPAVLDAQLFENEILRRIMGVDDIRTDDRIHYHPGPWGLDAFRHQVNQMDSRVGFCLYPVKLQEMMVLSDHQVVMPPKSTWFEPRMKNGMIVHEFGHPFLDDTANPEL